MSSTSPRCAITPAPSMTDSTQRVLDKKKEHRDQRPGHIATAHWGWVLVDLALVGDVQPRVPERRGPRIGISAMNTTIISVERNIMFVKVPAPRVSARIEKRFGNRRGACLKPAPPGSKKRGIYDFEGRVKRVPILHHAPGQPGRAQDIR